MGRREEAGTRICSVCAPASGPRGWTCSHGDGWARSHGDGWTGSHGDGRARSHGDGRARSHGDGRALARAARVKGMEVLSP